jgi:hypothetical protein
MSCLATTYAAGRANAPDDMIASSGAMALPAAYVVARLLYAQGSVLVSA